MKRLDTYTFINGDINKDKIVALEINNGHIYFIGWMEDAESYSIQWAGDENEIYANILRLTKDLYHVITHSPGYDDFTYDETTENEYKYFLECLNENIQNIPILKLKTSELIALYDVLKDGIYVLVME